MELNSIFCEFDHNFLMVDWARGKQTIISMIKGKKTPKGYTYEWIIAEHVNGMLERV